MSALEPVSLRKNTHGAMLESESRNVQSGREATRLVNRPGGFRRVMLHTGTCAGQCVAAARFMPCSAHAPALPARVNC